MSQNYERVKCPECKAGQYELPSGTIVPCRLCRGTGEMSQDRTNSLIVLRLPRKRKASYVRQAAQSRETLSDWIFRILDAASGFVRRESDDASDTANLRRNVSNNPRDDHEHQP